MGRITDDGLIEVADMHVDAAVRIPSGPQIAGMAVSAYPDRRTAGQTPARLTVKPLIELRGIASNERVRRPRHFQIAQVDEGFEACVGTRRFHRKTLKRVIPLTRHVTRMFQDISNLISSTAFSAQVLLRLPRYIPERIQSECFAMHLKTALPVDQPVVVKISCFYAVRCWRSTRWRQDLG